MTESNDGIVLGISFSKPCHKVTRTMQECWRHCLGCCFPTFVRQSSVESLFPYEDLDDVEFEHLLQEGITPIRQEGNVTPWDRLFRLFRGEKRIRLLDTGLPAFVRSIHNEDDFFDATEPDAERLNPHSILTVSEWTR
jgi:hypothetical protein